MEAIQSKGYLIKIDNFEGPFDLLFHLFEKNQVNIYDIPINEITDQYMDYLFSMQEMDLEIASDFLLMAATLLHIKSKMLLPEKKEVKEQEIDPIDELVSRLLEYGKFKEFTHELREREHYWDKATYKLPEPFEVKHTELVFELDPVALKDCYVGILKKNLRKVNKGAQNIVQILQHEKVSLRSKIREVMRNLIDFSNVRFSKLFSLKQNSRTEVVTGFMAILELTKLKRVWLEQEKPFSEITIHRKDDATLDDETDLSHLGASDD